MGRVAKYKKVKSFDPYSKKNKGNIDLPTVGVWGLGDDGRRKKKRSQKAERMHARKHKLKSKKNNKNNKFLDDGGFDAPPMEKDEFDMADLMGSLKKQKVETKDILGNDAYAAASSEKNSSNNSNNNSKKPMNESYEKVATSTGTTAHIPKTDRDETQVTRLLRLDKQEAQKSEKERQLSHARMEGESKNAYNKRTRAETRQIIKNSTTTKNHEKLQRKKEFLKNKKNRKRKGGGSSWYNDDDDNDNNNDTSYTSQRGRGKDALPSDEPVRFGEQAERPPIFRQIPRGAKSKSKTTIEAAKSAKTEGMSEHQIEAERDAMELMRRRVQAQYKAIKSKRKDVGDFHL